MNIIKYKNIDELVTKKDIYLGQEIDNNALKLISKGYIPTKFNVGINDVLEFVLYDISNNVLTQESFGNVRYIKGDEIKNYLLESNNPSDAIYEGGGFVVDIKRLIKEAGYNTGYYRVQINFLNNRVGSDYQTDKMWIQEISSTRLEMRLLPFNNFDEKNPVELDIKNDLNEAYDSFILGKFSGDEVYEEIYNILDSIKASDVANIMKTVVTQATIDKIAQEFNIVGGYDLFYAKVLDDMKKAVVNELLYRNSIIGSNDFGKPISDTIRNKISQKDYNYYNKEDIIRLLNSKFRESVSFHLPKRTLDETLKVDSKTQESLDALNEVVQTLQKDTQYQIPNIEKTVIVPTTNNSPAPAEQVYQTQVNIGTSQQVVVSTESTDIAPSPIAVPDPNPTPSPITQTLTFITGPTVNNITTNTAEITWSTNVGASAKIIFNAPCPYNGCEGNLIRAASSHVYYVSGLIPNTMYSFVIVSSTNDGTTLSSNTINFETLVQTADTTVPQFNPYAQTSTTTKVTEQPTTVPITETAGTSTSLESYSTQNLNPDIVGSTTFYIKQQR